MRYMNIEAERARKGISIEKMCRDLDTSRSTYYSWRKIGNIPANKLIAMAKYFDVTTDYLLGRNLNTTAYSPQA